MKPKLLTPLQDYSLKLFAADALAGITVAMVALPLSIAIAIASGAQPAAGLVTAIIGGLLHFPPGGNQVPDSGPTRALIVAVYGVGVAYGIASFFFWPVMSRALPGLPAI